MSRRPALVTASVVALVLGLAMLTMRVPYVELRPGPVTDTLGKDRQGRPVITITGGRTYPAKGRIALTTVGVVGGPPGPITLAEAVRAWLDPSTAVLPQTAVFPPNRTAKEVEQRNTLEMTESQEHALSAALQALDIPVDVVVAEVIKGRPADGQLRKGDVVTAVDGQVIRSLADLRRLIGTRRPGTPVRLSLLRDGERLTLTIPTVPDSEQRNRAIVGVISSERPRGSLRIKINLKDIGGPSAGLMFTLGIIDKLSPGDLTGGQYVAGTGTIDDVGDVGPIGGIQQKVIAARRAGATVFLTPAENCAAAKRVRPAGLQLVRVSELDDALSALAALRAGRQNLPAC